MGGQRAPSPPDPQQTAAAQTGTNVGTAVANQVLGNVNQRTPYGSLTYNQTGMTKWTDPNSGKVYDLPQYTAVQTLSAGQKQLSDEQLRGSTNLATLGADQSARLGSILGKPMNIDGAPTVRAPNLQSTIGDAGEITRTYGTDFSRDRNRVEKALLSRINPSLDQDRAAMTAKLANQGIKVGTEAYDREMGNMGRQANDARYGAILAGGEEQSRLVGLEADRAAFENGAQGQRFQQLMARAGLGNTAKQQNFGNQQGLRSSYLQEQYAERNQPINEIGALLGTGQVQNPNFINPNTSQMPTTDYAGLVGQNYNQRLAAWQQNQQGRQNMMGGLFGLAATGIGAF